MGTNRPPMRGNVREMFVQVGARREEDEGGGEEGAEEAEVGGVADDGVGACRPVYQFIISIPIVL